MAHRSLGRDRHFARLNYTVTSPELYVKLLAESPYKAHRKAAPVVEAQLKDLLETAQKEASTEAFAKTLGLEKLTPKTLEI